jgi:predicted glycosyltransferase/broad specificity phosphatase PhoE
MTRLVVLRHGQTDWNAARRLQGTTDTGVTAASLAALRARALPGEFDGLAVQCSPLRRAKETAAALGIADFAEEPRIAEMDWGEYTGRTVAELNADLGPAFAANENLGLDFRPKGGESPRDVQLRLGPWLARLAADRQDTLAITHRGVIRALQALAHDWDMRGKPPAKLCWDHAHEFTVEAGGRVRPGRYNIPLPPRAAPAGGAKRVLIYVQHLLGSGHLRRVAIVAQALRRAGLDVAVASGGAAVAGVDWHGVAFTQLPPLSAADESFRTLVDAAGRPIDDAWRATRRDALLALWRRWQPQVLMVELFPFGRRALRFELLPLLDAAKAADRRPLIVCSLRDILTQKDAGREADMLDLAKRYFDRVLVHGDPKFVTLDRSFSLAPQLAGRLHYTGYVAAAPPPPSGAKFDGVIVSAGGGRVGAALIEAAIEARAKTRLAGAPWRILAGTLGGGDGARRGDLPHGVTVEPAHDDFANLLAHCRLSVSQGGYNTMMDVVQAGVPAVVVPFSRGGETEQGLRAKLLGERGLVTVLPEAELTPDNLAAAIDAALAKGSPARIELATDGAAASARMVTEWVSQLGW